MPLPNDISRCVGRTDMTAETDICPMRNRCERYLSLIEMPMDKQCNFPVVRYLCQDARFAQLIER